MRDSDKQDLLICAVYLGELVVGLVAIMVLWPRLNGHDVGAGLVSLFAIFLTVTGVWRLIMARVIRQEREELKGDGFWRLVWGVEFLVVALLGRSRLPQLDWARLALLFVGFYVQAGGVEELVKGERQRRGVAVRNAVVGLAAMVAAVVGPVG